MLLGMEVTWGELQRMREIVVQDTGDLNFRIRLSLNLVG